jgi:NADH dehydrogenase
VDRRNHHLFQPLLYQVATASLNPSEIAAPIRRILRKQLNAEVILGNAVAIDPSGDKVLLADGEVSYDYLILATGVTHSYFGQEQWAKHAPGLKSVEDALELRRRLLVAFEVAEREPDQQSQREWLTFVIVGGGPTGVELAGALSEISRRTLRSDFRHIDPQSAQVILLEGASRILPALPEKLSNKATEQLEKLGVEVRTGGQVTDIRADGVMVGEEFIKSRTVFWAAGVAASPLARTLGVDLDRAGRVMVQPDLSVPGHPNIFVIGDLANIEQDGHPIPGVAPAAMQQGRHAGRNIALSVQGRPTRPFRYVDKGMLATVGRAAAVADIKGLKLSGFIAWLAWLGVHIWFLIGFRNRFVVMLEWTRAYLTNERQARLITQEVGPLLPTNKLEREEAAQPR